MLPPIVITRLKTSSTVHPAGSGRPAGKPWAVAEAAEFLGVSSRTLWRMIDAKEIKVTRVGRRVLLPDNSVRRLAGDEAR
jgi:excisionase family DNA binding protein